jgi:acyl carrier protein
MTSTAMSSDFTHCFNEILLRHLRLVDGRDIPENVDLMKLGLDSISAVALLLDLEEAFGILFPESMITVKLYESSSVLKNAVLTQMEHKHRGTIA